MIEIKFGVRLEQVNDPLIMLSDHCLFFLLPLNHILNNPLELVVIGSLLPLDQVVFDDFTMKYLIGKVIIGHGDN